jgi:molybdopterin synthase catalytic subunit
VSHRIGPEPLSVEAALADVLGPDCGAVVHFAGSVRDNTRGKSVVALEYEAYAEMALAVFGQIAAGIAAQWPGARAAIHHRVGRLVPGELSVVIAAASAHRDAAFAACRFAIEALKKDAPIWKREIYTDGSTWVGLGS